MMPVGRIRGTISVGSRHIECHVPSLYTGLRLINALIYQLCSTIGWNSASGALREEACDKGKQDVNRTRIDIDSCHQGPVCHACLLPIDVSRWYVNEPNFSTLIFLDFNTLA